MAVVSAILRFLAYLYHGLLALTLLALGTVLTLANAGNSVRMDMLAWGSSSPIAVLLCGGILGLVITLLAIAGKVRPLFFLWALIVFIFIVKGYFLSTYHFTPDEFNKVLYLTVGAIIALLGAFVQLFAKPKRM